MGTIKFIAVEIDGVELDVPTEYDLKNAVDYVGISLDNLSDTTVTNPQIDEYLSFDGSVWVNKASKEIRLKTTTTLSNSSNTTFVNITALQLNLVAGKTYYLRGILAYTSAATATGLSWSLDGTSNGRLSILDTAPNTRTAAQSYSAVAKAGIMTHTATPTNTSTEMVTFDAVYACTGSGTLYPKFRSETNGSAIVIQSSSIMECIEI
jgi:hypothetical protein